MSSAIALSAEAADVALGEAQAVLAMVQDEERRGRLADLVAAVGEGELTDGDADALAELLELGLQAGRLRALYGPGGEQAALRLFRKLPRGKELDASAREVTGAPHLSRREVARECPGRGHRPGLVPRLARRRRARACGPPRPKRGSRDERRALAMAEKRYYMTCLDLEGRSCLVVGGGRVALEKVRSLLECGARVTVVAPRVVPELDALDVEAVRRRYRASDLDGRFLVVAATATSTVDRRVSADADARSLFCNVADVPELCSFILPAVLRRDPIAVAVSTGGASPALAQRIRDDVDGVIGPEHVALARRLRDLRPLARSQLPTYEDRRRFFAELVAKELA